MNTAAPAPDAPAPRRRRWPIVLVALAIAALVLVIGVRVLLPPERALRLALDQLGPLLGLDIRFEGDVEYRLRGTPQLVVHDVSARIPGETTPLLRAERVLLSLPWSTIRSREADLQITRVELDAPQLSLPALARWLDSRPPGDGRVPTFTDGLRIRDGVLDADGWRIDALRLDVPALHADRPVDASVAGTLVAGTVQAPFRLQVTTDRAMAARSLGATGTVTVRTASGRLDTRVRIDATRTRPGDPGLHFAPLRLAADAHWRARATSLPFAFGLQGDLAFEAGRLVLAPVGVATRGGGVVPTLAAGGRIVLDTGLQVSLDGHIAQWPDAWPALPAPLSASREALPFALRYDGPSAFDAPLGLHIVHAGARFDGSARMPEVLQWLDAIDTGSPLPPLQGRLTAERLEISGATLEGLQIDFDDGRAE